MRNVRKIALLAVAFSFVTMTLGSQAAMAAPSSTNVLATLGVQEEKSIEKANETKQTEEKPASQAKTEPAAPAPVMVTVNEGDSLSTIAAAHNTTWVRLFNANEVVQNPDVITAGMQLRVPTPEEQLADRPLPQPVIVAAPTTNYSYRAPARSYSAPAANYPTDPNAAKAFIYSRESGNNPNATNPNGCYGIGQDCNGVVRSTCGANYACQDQYFTNYAVNRYGSWEGAYSFWQQNHWW